MMMMMMMMMMIVKEHLVFYLLNEYDSMMIELGVQIYTRVH